MNLYVVFSVFVFCGIDCGALDAERMALGGLRCNHRTYRTYRSHSLQRKWEYVWYMFDISRQYFLWTICRRYGKYVKTDNILWIECVCFFLSFFISFYHYYLPRNAFKQNWSSELRLGTMQFTFSKWEKFQMSTIYGPNAEQTRFVRIFASYFECAVVPANKCY